MSSDAETAPNTPTSDAHKQLHPDPNQIARFLAQVEGFRGHSVPLRVKFGQQISILSSPDPLRSRTLSPRRPDQVSGSFHRRFSHQKSWTVSSGKRVTSPDTAAPNLPDLRADLLIMPNFKSKVNIHNLNYSNERALCPASPMTDETVFAIDFYETFQCYYGSVKDVS